MAAVWDEHWFGSDQDARRARRLAAAQARRRPTRPALHPHRPRCRVSAPRRAHRETAISLRARLILFPLGYVLLLAIVAFGVPLGLNLSARVNAEGAPRPGRRPTSSRPPPPISWRRAAAASWGARPHVARPDPRPNPHHRSRWPRPGRQRWTGPRSAPVTPAGPRLARALHGRPVQFQRRSRTLESSILATAAPIIHEGRPGGRGACHPGSGFGSGRGAPRRARPRADRWRASCWLLGLPAARHHHRPPPDRRARPASAAAWHVASPAGTSGPG